MSRVRTVGGLGAGSPSCCAVCARRIESIRLPGNWVEADLKIIRASSPRTGGHCRSASCSVSGRRPDSRAISAWIQHSQALEEGAVGGASAGARSRHWHSPRRPAVSRPTSHGPARCRARSIRRRDDLRRSIHDSGKWPTLCA